MANSNRKSSRKTGGFDGKYIVPILVVASLVMLAAFAVSADGNAGLSETKEYNCGPAGSEEAVKATLDTDTGLLTVDAKVTSDMGNYGDGEAPWYGDRDYIKRVASTT